MLNIIEKPSKNGTLGRSSRNAMKLISLDIDGVLTDYPACWLEYLNHSLGTSFSNKEEAQSILGEDAYRREKTAYRTSEYKENLPFKEGARAFCDELVRRGYTFIITTSRLDISRTLTEKWLKRREIKYSKLLIKRLDESFLRELSGITLHVDDEMEYVSYMLRHGLPAILLDTGGDINRNAPAFNSYESILEALPS